MERQSTSDNGETTRYRKRRIRSSLGSIAGEAVPEILEEDRQLANNRVSVDPLKVGLEQARDLPKTEEAEIDIDEDKEIIPLRPSDFTVKSNGLPTTVDAALGLEVVTRIEKVKWQIDSPVVTLAAELWLKHGEPPTVTQLDSLYSRNSVGVRRAILVKNYDSLMAVARTLVDKEIAKRQAEALAQSQAALARASVISEEQRSPEDPKTSKSKPRKPKPKGGKFGVGDLLTGDQLEALLRFKQSMDTQEN